MKNVLSRPKKFGRLTKTSIELSEFDIKYQSQMVVKEHAMVDFVA